MFSSLFGGKPSKEVSVEVGEAKQGESKIRRHFSVGDKDLLKRPPSGVTNLYDLLKEASQKYAEKPQWGSRKVVRIVEEQKEVTKIIGGERQTEVKTWKFFELSGYSYLTYAEAFEQTNQIGCGLRHLGLNPKDRVTIFAPTSREWSMMAYGCFTQNLTITTAYDSLGPDGLSHALNESEATTLFTTAELLSVVEKIIERCDKLANIVYFGEISPEKLNEHKSKLGKLRVHSLDELKAMGIEHPCEPSVPSPDDLACIMYTSGSTGTPKGAVITQGNIISALAGALPLVEHRISPDDTYLAFLPLAHILELLIEVALLYLGVTIGYGSPKTLTAASVRNCNGDIKEFRPSLISGVPAVWESIRKGVLAQIQKQPQFKQTLFYGALNLKSNLMSWGLPSGFLDILFKPIRDNTGGRLRFGVSGGAPIPTETHRFISAALCPILQGYGMTEVAGLIGIQYPEDAEKITLGKVGPPSPAVEAKLVDVASAGYFVTNKPNPQGELWVRGPSVISGYYKQPKATEEAFTSDGWLMTGDIAEFQPDGTISIIDRKKNLVKLLNGEYIALEKLEAIYKTAQYVQNICVTANSERPFPVAIVQPNFLELEKLAQTKSLVQEGVHMEPEEIAAIPELKKIVFDSLMKVFKDTGLVSAERLAGITLACEEWTPQNGFLTAAMKLKRAEITRKYKDEVNKLYSSMQ